MDWLKYLGLQPAPPNPILTNPVGTSTMQRVTNPSQTVSPVASALLDSPDQRIGRFWKLATGQAKPAYTGADMPGLAAAGNEAIDAGIGWATTTPKLNGIFPPLGMGGGELTKAKLPTWRPNEVADDIAARLQGDGFRVSINRGSGPVGPSAYLNIFDPETRRYLMKEVRVSDHSTGATRFKDYHHVLGPDDIDGILELAQKMRARGPATQVSAPVSKTTNAGEEAAHLLSEKAARAYPDEWAKWADKSGAAAKKARQELRRRYVKDYGGNE